MTGNIDNTTSEWEYSVADLPGDASYPVVDIVKFLCAYLILTIHIFPSQMDYGMAFSILSHGLRNFISRIAVPFYFTSAAFFLFRKVDFSTYNHEIIKNYVFKILRLYATWIILLFIGSKTHLWYMSALVVAVLAASYLFSRNISVTKIVLLCVFLYAIGLLGDSYYGLLEYLRSWRVVDITVRVYEKLFHTTRNGVFMGLIFVVMGALFAQKKIILTKGAAIGGFMLSFLAFFGEVLYLKYLDISRDSNMYICLLPVTFFLFYIAAHIRVKERELYKKLRAVGVLIFFSHFFVCQGVSWFFSACRVILNVDMSNPLLLYAVTIVVVTLFSFILEYLSHKEKFSLIRFLYS